jgi:hypothetical protein
VARSLAAWNVARRLERLVENLEASRTHGTSIGASMRWLKPSGLNSLDSERTSVRIVPARSELSRAAAFRKIGTCAYWNISQAVYISGCCTCCGITERRLRGAAGIRS